MILQWISMVIIGLGGVIVFLFCFFIAALIMGGIDVIFQKHYERGKQAQYEIDKARLQEACNWFGECPATRRLLMDLAGGCDASSSRERWRAALQKQQ